jgi:hypothetical protein
MIAAGNHLPALRIDPNVQNYRMPALMENCPTLPIENFGQGELLISVSAAVDKSISASALDPTPSIAQLFKTCHFPSCSRSPSPCNQNGTSTALSLSPLRFRSRDLSFA